MRSRQLGRRSERGSICLDCFEHRTRGDVVVGGERQPPPPGDLGAVTAAAAEDPDVELGALTGDDVRFGAGGVSIGAADQRQHVVDLLGVLGRLRIRLLQEPELEGEARRADEVGERVRRRDQQAVVGAPTGRRCGRRRRGGAGSVGWWRRPVAAAVGSPTGRVRGRCARDGRRRGCRTARRRRAACGAPSGPRPNRPAACGWRWRSTRSAGRVWCRRRQD